MDAAAVIKLDEQDATAEGVEKFVLMLNDIGNFTKVRKGKAFDGSRGLAKAGLGTLTFGLYAYGSQRGLTSNCEKMPNMCRYVNWWLQHQDECRGVTWTSVIVNFNVKSDVRTDRNNLAGSLNATVAFGNYQGGKLWLALPGDHQVRSLRSPLCGKQETVFACLGR